VIHQIALATPTSTTHTHSHITMFRAMSENPLSTDATEPCYMFIY